MEISWGRAMWRNFLGQSPDWYKLALLIFLIINPLIFFANSFVAGWLLVAEFIFTLADGVEVLSTSARRVAGH
ncbi:regulator of intracellular pH; Na+/H+ antiporter [Salmonella bongori]|nr:regulator of intracellular pH; Na+/H+ antiporter [Salmonella bongori]